MEGYWTDRFNDRQLGLIRNCQQYANGEPAGLPGHRLMLIIAKMAELLHRDAVEEEERGEGVG